MPPLLDHILVALGTLSYPVSIGAAVVLLVVTVAAAHSPNAAPSPTRRAVCRVIQAVCVIAMLAGVGGIAGAFLSPHPAGVSPATSALARGLSGALVIGVAGVVLLVFLRQEMAAWPSPARDEGADARV